MLPVLSPDHICFLGEFFGLIFLFQGFLVFILGVLTLFPKEFRCLQGAQTTFSLGKFPSRFPGQREEG